MKKMMFLLLATLLTFGTAGAQTNKTLEKALKKEYKRKLKEYSKEGWKLAANSRTLEVVLLQHYDKLNNPNNQEIVGEVSQCKSLNVGRQMAQNNAYAAYAAQATQTLKGRINSDVFANASDDGAQSEFDKFYAAFERLLNTEVKAGTLQESYALYRELGDGLNAYRAFYIVNEDKAQQARIKAMQRALEETKMAQKYATEVSKFINEGLQGQQQLEAGESK